MLLAAAVVPAAPLLIPELAGGSAALDEGLRRRCRAATTALTAADDVIVVGDAPRTGEHAGGWDFGGFGRPLRSARRPALPTALAIGDWLLDEVGWQGPRAHVGVRADVDPDRCAATGRELVEGRRRAALLVVADGSARRSEKAPGHLDPRAQGFDERVLAALRAADPAALLALDPGLARELMAAGRAAWQVLAGAAAGGSWQAADVHGECPYGVGYFVAVWRRVSTSADPA